MIPRTKWAVLILILTACGHAQRVRLPSSYAEGPKLAYIEEGSGAPVVFVHGCCADYRLFEPLREQVSKQFRFISLSRRYHFPNAPPGHETAYTYELQSKDLADFIQDLHAGPVHLVGHSWGGVVVLLTAINHPDLIRSIIVAEPDAGSLAENIPGAAAELKSRTAMIGEAKRRAEADDNRGAMEVIMDWVEGPAGGFGQLPKKSREMMFENAASVGAMLDAPPLKLTCAQVGQIHSPMLILESDHTRSYFHLIATKLTECTSGAENAVVPNSKHNMFLDNPTATADLILRFVAKHATK